MAQKRFLNLLLIIGDMIFEAEIASAHSCHELVFAFELDRLFLRTQQIKLVPHMNNWNGKIICVDDLLHCIFEFVILLILNQKWYRFCAKKFMGPFREFLVRDLFDVVHIDVCKMFEEDALYILILLMFQSFNFAVLQLLKLLFKINVYLIMMQLVIHFLLVKLIEFDPPLPLVFIMLKS